MWCPSSSSHLLYSSEPRQHGYLDLSPCATSQKIHLEKGGWTIKELTHSVTSRALGIRSTSVKWERTAASSPWSQLMAIVTADVHHLQMISGPGWEHSRKYPWLSTLWSQVWETLWLQDLTLNGMCHLYIVVIGKDLWVTLPCDLIICIKNLKIFTPINPFISYLVLYH